MPTIKDVARKVITTHWDISSGVFDMLWDDVNLDEVSYAALVANPLAYLQPALAHDGAGVEQVVIAVIAVRAVDLGITTDQPLGKIGPALQRFCQSIGHEGTGAEVWVQMQSSFPADTIISPSVSHVRIVADAYTHNGKQELTEKLLRERRDDRASFIIFIHHPRSLRPRSIGEVYLHPEYTTPKHLPPLEYRVLVHLLKHRNDPGQRTLPVIVEQCWDDPAAAKDIQNAKKLSAIETQRYLRRISALSDILWDSLRVRVQSEGTGKWDLMEWPATFCVLAERDSIP